VGSKDNTFLVAMETALGRVAPVSLDKVPGWCKC